MIHIKKQALQNLPTKKNPQVRIVCQMELSSDLIADCTFDNYKVNEIMLAEKLIKTIPDNSFILFDKGFYSLGLLHKWQTTSNERHWLTLLKKSAAFSS
jgi:hypothetical protein